MRTKNLVSSRGMFRPRRLPRIKHSRLLTLDPNQRTYAHRPLTHSTPEAVHVSAVRNPRRASIVAGSGVRVSSPSADLGLLPGEADAFPQQDHDRSAPPRAACLR